MIEINGDAMKSKNIISMDDFSKEEIEKMFSVTDELKERNIPKNGKTAALLFNRPSTRTHVSFAVALQHMGYESIYLDYVFTQMVRGEQLKDSAKAISQYVELIIARLVPHHMLEEFVQHSDVPVVNAGSDNEHPCQALGDLYTLKKAGKLKTGNVIAFIGDPQDAVANSLAIGAMKLGLKFIYICPQGYEPLNKKAGVSHIISGVKGASAIYTNAWARETSGDVDPKRMRDLLSYQLNKEVLLHAPDALIMHPLPATRGLEISDEMIDSKNSVVWKQVKNRLYVQKAVINMLEK